MLRITIICGFILAALSCAFLAGVNAAEMKHPAYYKARNLLDRILGREQEADRNALYYLEKASLYEMDTRRDYDVVFIGDSLTDGANWQSFFRNYSVANRGINGDTSRGLLKRIDNLSQTGASRIFIMIGVNDISRKFELDETIDNYQTVVKQLLATNAEVFLQSTLLTRDKVINPQIKRLNTWLINFASTTDNVNFIDLNSQLTTDGLLDAQYTIDGIHLNGAGYEVWRNNLVPLLN